MTDPVLALVLIVAALAGLLVVRFFKTLGSNLDIWMTPLIAGVASGVVVRLIGISAPYTIAIVLTLAVLYVRLTGGHESEPIDGMLLGAACGRLVLSGILDSQIDLVTSRLLELGIQDLEIDLEGEWIALIV